MVRVGDNTATAVAGDHQPGRSDLRRRSPIPQVFLPDLRAAMAKGNVKVNALVDDNHASSRASIAFIENTVDPMTGTVMAKARIANANEGLWPGQFVKVEVVLGIEPEAIVRAGAGGPARPAGSLHLRRQGRQSPRCARSASSAPRAANR